MKIEKPLVSFDTEYDLEQFREIEKDNFDSDGKKHAGVPMGRHTAEQMLKLINQLESELKLHVRFSNEQA